LKPAEYVFRAARHLGWETKCGAGGKTVTLCNAPKVDAYLTELGMKLVRIWTHMARNILEFHCVNDRSINAFALPALCVRESGAIEVGQRSTARGVMAHEFHT